MDSIKDFGISTTFILVCSVCLLFFVIIYPSLNGSTSIILSDPSFNQTANNLTTLLGNFQNQTNTEINVSTADTPTINAQSLQLFSSVSNARTQMSRFTAAFSLIINLIANQLGLSSGQFLLISGAIIALFGLVLLYYVIRFIRWGQ